MRKTIFLATTALEDFWDLSQPMVFLSDACTRYSRKEIWEKHSQEILRNPLFDRREYYKNYEYVQSFYERMLPQIGEMLNEIHGQKYDTRYWRIVLGYWLFSYIHVLYERYSALKNALREYPDLTTIVLDAQDFMVPRDTRDFSLLTEQDCYNLQLYSKIFTFLKKDFPLKRYAYPIPHRSSAETKSPLKTLRTGIGRRFAGFAPVLGRQPFIPRHIDKLSFLIACRGNLWFDFGPDEELPFYPLDPIKRKRLAHENIEAHEFEELFEEILPSDIPQIFVEGYLNFQKHARQLYPFKPKAIWSATSWCWEEAFKFWAAERSQEGATLAGMQHGGNYGMEQIHPSEEYELTICDKYYSWGWEKEGSLVKPMPVTKYIGRKRLHADNHKEGILLATAVGSRYNCRLQAFRSVDIQLYIQWQQWFIKALSPELKSRTRVRLFINDYGWDCRERWHDFDPRVILEDWKTSFADSMKNCRLHVSDHLSSTFVDALSVGKPTILFWDPEVFKVRPQAQLYMDDLYRAGIFYHTPQAAAAAAIRIYNDVESWWNQPQRQNTVEKFCYRFARTSPTALNEWSQEIAALAKGGTNVSH